LGAPLILLMHACPYCQAPLDGAGTGGKVTIDFGVKRTERRATEHLCKACGKKFTVVRGRGEEVLMSAKAQERTLSALRKERSRNASLAAKARTLGEDRRSASAALKRAKEGAYLKSLEYRLAELQRQVEYLKGEKARLQELLALV
jgi:hypothetical protein